MSFPLWLEPVFGYKIVVSVELPITKLKYNVFYREETTITDVATKNISYVLQDFCNLK